MSQDCSKAVIKTVQTLYWSLFPNLTPEQLHERMGRSGLHHHLLEIAYPEADDAEGDEYGEFLDGFEGELMNALEQTYERMMQEKRKKRKRRR
jgi:hypothetical protein